jgi:LysR family glycine cleavage system transcriptional activator
MEWRDIPSLAALRAFDACARTGSFSAAARALNVTHAAIAQHVRAIETQLGQSLMVRVGKTMQLTENGETLAAALAEGFGHIISGVQQVANDAASSPLKLSMTPSFAENWLMPKLPSFWETHPEITVSITPDNAVVDLRRDGFDLAIRYGLGDWPGVDAAFLVPADYAVVAAPTLFDDPQTACVSELTKALWLFERVHQAHRKWAEENVTEFACCQVKELPTLNMVLSAVRAGGGATVMSLALVADDIAQGKLIALQIEKHPGLGYYVVTLPGVPAAKVTTFRKWILAQA